jgi:hypothetical protein
MAKKIYKLNKRALKDFINEKPWEYFLINQTNYDEPTWPILGKGMLSKFKLPIWQAQLLEKDYALFINLFSTLVINNIPFDYTQYLTQTGAMRFYDLPEQALDLVNDYVFENWCSRIWTISQTLFGELFNFLTLYLIFIF